MKSIILYCTHKKARFNNLVSVTMLNYGSGFRVGNKGQIQSWDSGSNLGRQSSRSYLWLGLGLRIRVRTHIQESWSRIWVKLGVRIRVRIQERESGLKFTVNIRVKIKAGIQGQIQE